MIAPAILIALVTTMLLGVALTASIVMDRRRSETKGRISGVLGAFTSVTGIDDAAPQLERLQAKPTGLLRWMPGWLRLQIEAASAMAGGRISALQLLLVAAGAALIVIFVGSFLGLGAIPIVAVAAVAAAGMPLALIRFEKARYDRKFLAVFADALDLIVRAIRSGLPVPEPVTNVGFEIDDPVGKEFRAVSDQMSIAVDMNRALREAAERIRITDFQFFVASLALQRQTGGNLAETLANLSTTIRRRNEARLKVRALSSEGRISALLLSCMPGFLAVATYFLNPDYIGVLLKDPRGHIIILAAIGSLAVGIIVMRMMIRRVLR